MKTGFLIVALVITFIPFSAFAINSNVWDPSILKGPLVTCHGAPTTFAPGGNTSTATPNANSCQNLCDLIGTFLNVVYFAIGLVIWILAPIAFAISGILFLVAGARSESISTAKNTLTGSVVGVGIVLLSWVIVNTVVSFFGITGIGGFGTSTNCLVAPATPSAFVMPHPSFISSAYAQSSPATITINPNIPGQSTAATTPQGIVANFYQFALLIGGILAVGVIVYGGLRRAFAAGDPHAQQEANAWIKAAVYGILLLAGAYIILNTINPDLVNLGLPGLPAANVSLPAAPPGVTVTTSQCASGTCAPLRSAGISCKDPSTQPGGVDSCFASTGMISTLQCIAQQPGAPQIIVTEAMPPTVRHISSCHNNGCCVDVVVAGFTSCSQVSALMSAVQACGATAANEYVAAQCPGASSFDTTTGNNVHINSSHTGGC